MKELDKNKTIETGNVTEQEIYYDNKILVKHKELCNGNYTIVFRTYIVINNGLITIEKYENEKLIETYNLANVKKQMGGN